MLLKAEINSDFIKARKNKNTRLLIVLGEIKDKIAEYEREEKKEAIDHEIVKMVKKLLSEVNQTIESAEKAERKDIVDEACLKRVLFETYLPPQLTEEETTTAIKNIIEKNEYSSMKDMSKIMNVFKEKFGVQANLKTAGKIAREILINN